MESWLHLHTKRGDTVPIRVDHVCAASEGIYFRRALRNRTYWARGNVSRLVMRELALGCMVDTIGGEKKAFGDPARNVETIRSWMAGEAVLQLTIPSDAPAAVFRFPWEYVLSAAFRPDGGQQHHAFVIRVVSGVKKPSTEPDWKKAQYVELTPGEVGELGWKFVGERAQAWWLGDEAVDAEFVQTTARNVDFANLASIRERAETRSPWLIHIAGFDASQARGLLRAAGYEVAALDAAAELHGPAGEPIGVGLVPTQRGARMVWSECHELARSVCAAEAKPALVVANLYESQTCVASDVVRLGAGAAVGFQDHIDDEVAERFTRELYLAIGDTKGVADERLVPAAFVAAARKAQIMNPTFHGSGVVLYLRSTAATAHGPMERMPWCAGPPTFNARPVPRRQPFPPTSDAERVRLHDVVAPELNFAMLCNGGTVFDAFYLKRQSDRRPCRASVAVSVHVGGKPQRYEEIVDLTETATDLTARIRVPVGWLRERMPSEPIRSLIDVAVAPAPGTKVTFLPIRKAHSVTILPVDSWKDDDLSRHWLPAFVLPRDPAVSRVLLAAQPHLDVLRGDAASGFDGYQAIDPQAKHPYAGVDAQAEAIWNGIVVGMDLRYVNPPPAYQEAIQRVRSPSRVLHESRGTCIDLAILLASALEYIGIWPVLFLLEGHCFVGYWRSEEGLDEFLEKARIGGDELRAERSAAHPAPPAGWIFDRSWYPVLRHEVMKTRQLVPLEATLLTSRQGFSAAVRDGKENLRAQRDFHSMQDVWAARDQGVTPLPFLEGTTLDNMGGRS